MKWRSFVPAIIMFLSYFDVFCQGNCLDSVHMKGYFVVLYNQEDILALRKNEKSMSLGKSYSIPLDVYKEDIFIPQNSANDLNKEISNMLNNTRKEAYVPCSKNAFYKLKALTCNNLIDSSYSCHFPNLESNRYYRLSGQKRKLCYQIFYIDAIWLKIEFDRQEKSHVPDNYGYKIDPRVERFNAYYFLKCVEYNNRALKNEKVKTWKVFN